MFNIRCGRLFQFRNIERLNDNDRDGIVAWQRQVSLEILTVISNRPMKLTYYMYVTSDYVNEPHLIYVRFIYVVGRAAWPQWPAMSLIRYVNIL